MATTYINNAFTELVSFSIVISPLIIALLVVIKLTSYTLRWWGTSKISPAHQREARAIQHEFDTVGDELADVMDEQRNDKGEVVRRKPRRSNAFWWVRYSVMARGKFLNPSNTPAMRRTIHKWIYEHMEADKVTKLDIARVASRATEWVYHADIGDIKAVKDRNSEAMVERELDLEAPWWSYWWGVSRRSIGKD